MEDVLTVINFIIFKFNNKFKSIINEFDIINNKYKRQYYNNIIIIYIICYIDYVIINIIIYRQGD